MKKLNLSFLHDSKFRYGSLSTALLCVAIAVLVALNGLFTSLEKKYGWRVDYSFNSITSHSATTEEVLSAMRPDALLFDLASSPGGVDWDAARALGRQARAELSLPARYAPLSAAACLRDCIDHIWEEET